MTISEEGLPLGYEVYPGNTYEGDTFKEAIGRLKKKYKLPTGNGVLWAMNNKDGNQVHPKAEHCGLPIKSGEKWIANVWVRSGTFV